MQRQTCGRLAARATTLALVLTAASAAAVGLRAQAPDRLAAARAEAMARGFDGFLQSDHFAVAWRRQEGDDDEVGRFLGVAETQFERISRIVGSDRTPTEPVFVALAGAGLSPDGSWRVPSVDEQGRIILVRYADGIEAYAQELTHELVHAFRRNTGYWLSGFLEEGFAEAIAMEAEPDEVGFPRYGYPLAVAAGHLLDRNEALPLGDLRTRHDELNRRCQLQAYLERAAFFDYLKRRGGIGALLRLAYRASAPTEADWETLFGAPFAALVEAWQADLRAAYAAIPDAGSQAQAYRALPPIAARNVCPA